MFIECAYSYSRTEKNILNRHQVHQGAGLEDPIHHQLDHQDTIIVQEMTVDPLRTEPEDLVVPDVKSIKLKIFLISTMTSKCLVHQQPVFNQVQGGPSEPVTRKKFRGSRYTRNTETTNREQTETIETTIETIEAAKDTTIYQTAARESIRATE